MSSTSPHLSSDALRLFLADYVRMNWSTAMDQNGDVIIANPKLAMFEQNKSEADLNFYVVSNFLDQMGMTKTLGVFELETDFQRCNIKDPKMKMHINMLEQELGQNSILTELLLWYVTVVEPDAFNFDTEGYLNELKQRLGWTDSFSAAAVNQDKACTLSASYGGRAPNQRDMRLPTQEINYNHFFGYSEGNVGTSSPSATRKFRPRMGQENSQVAASCGNGRMASPNRMQQISLGNQEDAMHSVSFQIYFKSFIPTSLDILV